VGVFRLVLPSGVFLLSQICLEGLGGRAHQDARTRSQLSDA